jgi:hypothetical protein
MKCETFHSKVVADYSITIRSKRFTGAQAGCMMLPYNGVILMSHSAGNTLVTHGAASDEVVKAI